jgi:non-homologous end joining protein Ku
MVTTLSEIDTADQYHEALKKLIESKIKGKKVVEFEVEELPRLDIMSALKKSLQASSRKPMVKAAPAASKKKALTLVKSVAKAKPAKKRKAS